MVSDHHCRQYALCSRCQQVTEEQDPAAGQPVREDTTREEESDRGDCVRGEDHAERPGSAALPDHGVSERERSHRGAGGRDQVGEQKAPEGRNAQGCQVG